LDCKKPILKRIVELKAITAFSVTQCRNEVCAEMGDWESIVSFFQNKKNKQFVLLTVKRLLFLRNKKKIWKKHSLQ